VVSAFAGLRPLVAPPPGRGLSPSSVSREEEIFTSESGLISLAGGKLTTYRLIAATVVDRVIHALRRGGDQRRFGRTRTGRVPLPGGVGDPRQLAAAACANDGHGLAPTVVSHLADRYGSRLEEVLGLIAQDPALGEPILPALPDPRAEILEAVEREWAVTLDDVLRRRTNVALRDTAGGAEVASQVAGLMAEPLGWDAGRVRSAAEAYTEETRAERRRWE
jgi:glycerol-3-phosphate dehydrogenase